MRSRELNQLLCQLLNSHGLDLTIHGQWLRPKTGYPAIRGTWYSGVEHPKVGCLQIEVALEDGRKIVETFAGHGDDRIGFNDALNTFTLGTLHVVLAACWDQLFEKYVSIENWSGLDKPSVTYIGDFVTRCSSSNEVSIPSDVLEVLKLVALQEELENNLHWIRLFVCNIGNGNFEVEVLLDNEPWELGRASVASTQWQFLDKYYSARCFLILKK